MHQTRTAAANSGDGGQRHSKTQRKSGCRIGGRSAGGENTVGGPNGLWFVADCKRDKPLRLVAGPQAHIDARHLPACREYCERCNNH